MRVCFVSSHSPKPCGIASYTSYLAEALCSSDPSFEGTLIAEEPAQQGSDEFIGLAGTFRHDDIYAEDVAAKVTEVAPDLVHIQHEYGIFGYDERFLTLLTKLKTLGIPTLVTLHTVHTKLSFNTGCVRPFERRLLRKVDIETYQRRIGELADLIIVHQETSIRQVLLRQGLPAEKVVVVPHGTRLVAENETNNVKEVCTEEDSPLVLAFGYLERSKNALLLIEAFRRLKAHVPNAKLWLGGYVRFNSPESLRYRERCLSFIEECGLQDDVLFAEKIVPEDQVQRVLEAADVACFVYNEDTHSSSGAMHLAMGLGKPIVASRIPKFEELSAVSDEILVNPASVRELHRLLTRMLSDEPFRHYIQGRVRSYAKQTSWSSVAQQHKAIYSRLLMAN